MTRAFKAFYTCHYKQGSRLYKHQLKLILRNKPDEAVYH